MAINYGIEILIASSDSAAKKAEITRKVLEVLEFRTPSITALNTSYSAGSSSTNQVGIEVTGASEDYGIRVIMDSAVVTPTVVARILRKILTILDVETVTLVTASSYTAGDRTYNMVITVT